MHPICLTVIALLATAFSFAPSHAQAPDYALPGNWTSTASREGAAATVPHGALPRRQSRDADIFYIHPTTDRSLDRDNQPIDDKVVNAWTDASVIARQASAFNRCCNVFAPRYRQATIGSARAGSQRRAAAMALAYADIRAAFDHYITHENNGRPFLLVGHSQGAAHLEKLLAERIDGQPLQERMVAAYVVGIGFAEGLFGRLYRSLRICDTPRQTGCVVHWNAMATGGKADETLALAADSYRTRFGDTAGATMLCVNPLSFDRRKPSRTKTGSRGAVRGAPDEKPVGPVLAGKVAARCEKGLLMVDASPALALAPLPNGSMHYHDIGLFYQDIRANSDARVDSHRRRQRAR